MNELIEKLLQPVSAEKPCGPDLANDPRDQALAELETILKGKPEVEMGTIKKPAEPPNWTSLKGKSVEFLGRSKNLRVAVMLTSSLLRTDGLPGFRDGMQLLRGLLEKYWLTLYPLLDPTSKNDPTERINILGALTAPRGSVFGSWLTFIDYLYATPICQPKGAPPVTMEHIEAAAKKSPAAGAPPSGSEMAKIAAVIRSAGGELIASQHQALLDALEATRAVDQFLTTTLGHNNAISFDVLEKALQDIAAALQPYLASKDGPAAAESTASAATADSGPSSILVSGSIRSREDVVRALDSLCEYYSQLEPSSPVPFLLRRAQKLATMDFVQAMQELKLATVETLRPSMGSAVDTAAGQKPPG